MGIIKAAKDAVGGMLADQWKEVVEPDSLDDHTVFASGVLIRRGSNVKGTGSTVSNGSTIHVYPNQFMMVVDGGKVVDYTAEPGYYTVQNSSLPSLFNGEFKDTLLETFNRIKYGGETPTVQKVYYVNLQEISGIKFGTRTPVNYFDSFYNAELFLRAHGTYSIRITNPLLFYEQVIAKNASRVEADDINEKFINEFLEALQVSINQMSAEGERISFVASKGTVLSSHMSEVLDERWKRDRGFEVMNVGIGSISYDETSQKLINLRNEGAMLSDPTVREGYVQAAIARGMEAAGSNANGAMAGFMGMGAGMNAGGGFMGAASATNLQQMQMNAAARAAAPSEQPKMAAPGAWTCKCGAANTGRFCSECGSPKPADTGSWTCKCGTVNKGKFCSECGSPRPENGAWICSCGAENTGRFCSECGKPRG